ncbi:MAG: hypothetical protein H3Z54_09625 [archaeon]|nr:hypothetical protein [archaeon]
MRKARRLKPLKIIIIKMVLVDDELPISSTRIRHREIDEEGHKIRYYNIIHEAKILIRINEVFPISSFL